MLLAWKAVSTLCLWSFLLSPLAFYALRAWRFKWLRGWRLLMAFAALSPLGWGLILGCIGSYSHYKWGLVAPYDDFKEMPPDVLAVAKGGPSGAACGFALFFGWLYLPVWTLLWLPVYAFLQALRAQLAIKGLSLRARLKAGIPL